jgi:hypothetical protein
MQVPFEGPACSEKLLQMEVTLRYIRGKMCHNLIGVIAFDPVWILIFLSGQDWSNTAYSDPA